MKNEVKKEEIFKNVYLEHFSRMKYFAQEYVVREEDAENIVQDVFMDLWENSALISTHTNLFSFLFTAVRNRCIDFLRRNTLAHKVKSRIHDENTLIFEMKLQSLEFLDEKIFSTTDIDTIVENAINSLPERCREIFVLNKIEGKKQKQIAEVLGISIHTVESQMAIANRKLKELLKEYVPLLIFLLF